MERYQEQDYYEILEIAPTAPQHEVYRAYQRAKATYGQDNPALYGMFSREEAKQVMRLIDEAYSVLGNPTLRLAYDDRRRALAGSPGAAQIGPTPLSHLAASAPEPAPSQEPLPDFIIPEAPELSWSPSDAQVEPQQLTEIPQPPRAPQPPPPAPERPASKSLKEGQGRTKFSVYQIDPEFEASLAHVTAFDGEVLKRVRKYKNLTLEQLSSASNIGLHYLDAIERNDFLALPVAVFVRGFVSQYARLLGLDERRVTQSYMQLYKETRGNK